MYNTSSEVFRRQIQELIQIFEFALCNNSLLDHIQSFFFNIISQTYLSDKNQRE
jgi:hypothetical protein